MSEADKCCGVSSSFTPQSSREAIRKKRELGESRKSGVIPAEKDEDGREINPHIPQYIAEAPWYLEAKGPSLKHQRATVTKVESTSSDQWYRRGIRKDIQVGKKYQKGACVNCGATTHAERECVERPRKRGAKLKGIKLAPDEIIPQQTIEGFEAKRDRWGGYKAQDFEEVLLEHQLLEREAAMRGKDLMGFQGDDEIVEDDAAKTSTRNLRIREDTAKYLINLDVNSAFFDPKSRSMRQDPTEGLDENTKRQIDFQGDNQLRQTGEAMEPHRMEIFAWNRYKCGENIHAVANPTATAMGYQEQLRRSAIHEKETQNSIVKKYGTVGIKKGKDED